MTRYIYIFRTFLMLLITGLVFASIAFAHLMVAQKGTLNLLDNGAYLVVSVATSSLENVDDDGDGLLSPEELSVHKASIIEQLKAGLQLSDANGVRPLEGLMLTLSPEDDAVENAPADQLIVMGRYALTDNFEALKEPIADGSLSFTADLWGTVASEQSLSLTITKNLEEEELLVVTPQHPTSVLYKSLWMVLLSYLQLGMEHVLVGLDHLLFLMVVIAAGLGWRKVFTALSVFTIGHAISLMVVVLGGITFPAQIVEPTITATIVGLALYDYWIARNKITPPVSRLAIVFACSLIHGLGLGGALVELGVNPSHQGATLLGFNLGIELAQLGVAALVLVGFAMLRQMFGSRSVRLVSSLMVFSAVVAGGIWFVERTMF